MSSGQKPPPPPPGPGPRNVRGGKVTPPSTPSKPSIPPPNRSGRR